LKATDILFVEYVDSKEENDELSVDFKENLLKHINTIHACAQFTLTVAKYKSQFEKKGRGSLKIRVNIKDINDILTFSSNFYLVCSNSIKSSLLRLNQAKRVGVQTLLS
jgi:hypothetical protein